MQDVCILVDLVEESGERTRRNLSKDSNIAPPAVQLAQLSQTKCLQPPVLPSSGKSTYKASATFPRVSYSLGERLVSFFRSFFLFLSGSNLVLIRHHFAFVFFVFSPLSQYLCICHWKI